MFKHKLSACVHYYSLMQFGNTPLHIASYKGRLDASKVLIAHGAKVDIQNDVSIAY